MSARVVSKSVYECVCELPDCPSKGTPWLSKELRIPQRCVACHRYTWNGTDLRVPDDPQPDDIRAYNRKKQAEARARRREETRKKRKKR